MKHDKEIQHDYYYHVNLNIDNKKITRGEERMINEREEEMLRICIHIVETEQYKDTRGHRDAVNYIIAMAKKFINK